MLTERPESEEEAREADRCDADEEDKLYNHGSQGSVPKALSCDIGWGGMI